MATYHCPGPIQRNNKDKLPWIILPNPIRITDYFEYGILRYDPETKDWSDAFEKLMHRFVPQNHDGGVLHCVSVHPLQYTRDHVNWCNKCWGLEVFVDVIYKIPTSEGGSVYKSVWYRVGCSYQTGTCAC